ncbi:MAG TPA: adenylosuccinate synthetase [Ktedonobacteraceae bacterium]
MQEKKQALVIADLGFGDAGKGTIVDFLTRRCSAQTIVRYNGGPQAAHNVVCADGRHHTFSQFASGMFLPGTRTLLSRFMLINPLNMLKEARHLNACGITDALQRVQIDQRALVITPFQRAINRLREIARAEQRHGSCGEGIGECMADALQYGDAVLQAGDLASDATLTRKLHFMRDAKWSEFAELEPLLPRTEIVRQESAVFTDPGTLIACAEVYRHFSTHVEVLDAASVRALFAQSGTMLFEGAQGILLDENYGFTPYTTWSTTTCANAQTLIEENNYTGKVSKIGVMRTYATRHGAGPFPTEDAELAATLPETHNAWNDWQRAFRSGHCDLVATRYARDVTGEFDYLALTHLDRLVGLPTWPMCTAYRYQGAPTDLSSHFEHKGNDIHALRVQRPPDLERQAQLTQLLHSCTPIYQTFTARPRSGPASSVWAEACSFIEEQLGAPIAITSDGPTAADKICRLLS